MLSAKNRFLSQIGSVAIEAAMVLPVLLLMTFGGIQLSAMYYDYQLVNAAATEAARQGVLSSASPLNNQGIAAVATSYLNANPLITFGNSATATVSVSLCTVNASGSTFTVSACSVLAQTSAQTACPATRLTPPAGNLLQVTVSYNFQGPYKAVTWANKTLSATTQFMCE
jgi:Flp pilus assembly protein TadG